MLSLFSGGVDGASIAAEWYGIETVAFCEIEPKAREMLRKHWPDKPIWEDVHDVTEQTLRDCGIGRIDILMAGIPCQPYSFAGSQKGDDDPRALWPQVRRIIGFAKPTWCLIENVSGFIGMALDGVLSDLESEGYETGALVLPACAQDAPHRRDRVFVVAYAAGP